MNTIDIVLGIFLIILFFNGLRKGFISSIIGLLGLVAVVLLVGKFGSTVKIMVLENLDVPDVVAMIISYIIIALIIALIFRFVIFILHRIADIFNLGVLNRILGGAFGIVSGAVIIAILLMIGDISPYYKEIRKFTAESKIVTLVRTYSLKIQKDYPKFKPPVKKKKENKSTIDNLKEDLTDEMNKSKDQMEEFIEEKTN